MGLRNGRMGGFKEWADGWVRVRGGYRFSSLMKQKKKLKFASSFTLPEKDFFLFMM